MYSIQRSKKIIITLGVAAVLAIGGGYVWYSRSHTTVNPSIYKTQAETKDAYVRFDMEAYDSIVTNYWQTPTEAGMAQLFQQSVEKALALKGIVGASTTLATQNRAGTAAMLARVFSVATSSVAKKELAVGILQVALYNLPPAGRDELLSQTQQVELRQQVSNINPTKDLYSDLGASAGAAIAEVNTAFAHKSAELAASSSPTAQVERAKVDYAHHVLTNAHTKLRYDMSQIEPTVSGTVMGRTLYIYISKMSPTTLEEFQDILSDPSNSTPFDSMIIDMRGNIGGSLDDAAHFLALFVGTNQYAFDLYSANTYNVVRTTVDKNPALARYHDIAILTDGMTQSTAEVLTASLKRLHLAHVVGATTRGWGTVENTFPMTTTTDASTTYALLLVRAITLRDDQTPIQGRGVDPDVKIADSDWKSQLNNYFTSSSIIAALKKEADQKPIQ